MKRSIFFLWIFLFSLLIVFGNSNALADEKLEVKIFHSINCKYCIDLKKDFLPKVLPKYEDKIEVEYLDIAKPENLQMFVALEKRFGVKARIPSILIGKNFLVGSAQIRSGLEPILKAYMVQPFEPTIRIGRVDLLEKFHSFSPLAIIAAGLIDGINPCAFTVLIFFISFLTLMGYKKVDLIIIGSTFILAVFLTYLAIGLGIFRGLYELKHFHLLLKSTYFGLAILCFLMAYFNLRDFFVYRRTRNTDSLKVKLPKPIRSRINAIISKYYRRDPNSQSKGKVSLIVSTFIVGILVSLLEAVCTGQVYLPTIVFILKEPALRVKAIFFLLLYNAMFVIPLLVILLLVVLGTSSKKMEEFFRKRVALVKILMFLLFLGLGAFLLAGV
ncbi:hypothetical protein ACFL2J_00910 [Candidatus Omnitrophota bacterium]